MHLCQFRFRKMTTELTFEGLSVLVSEFSRSGHTTHKEHGHLSQSNELFLAQWSAGRCSDNVLMY